MKNVFEGIMRIWTLILKMYHLGNIVEELGESYGYLLEENHSLDMKCPRK